MLEIIKRPSPHGAKNNDPKLVIWHCMGEKVGGKDAAEFLEGIGFSAHYLIYPDGRIIQCREHNQGAYHAKGHNTDTIGVELLVSGDYTYDDFIERIKTPWHWGDQYSAAVALYRNNLSELPMTQHCDIDKRIDANGNKVKQDLGAGFPFETFKSDCNFK